ncbi:Proteasome maturation protein-like protein [Auxenochlorella protothecoides]|nr:Proteasome maturation protein-like protein [Auxenochlorella protothecoides]KFM26017.1 Proteasome maturation protein-like protein [Auxenochlorella protothecoides]
MAMLKNVYGSGLPARIQIERQILERVGRLPGLPSSRIGLDSMSGALDDFSFEDYLGLPGDSEVAPPDLHSLMEAHLGMARVTKPASRAFL